MKKVTKAVIPAAGFGTRFLPATKAIAKEMFPIIDTPTLQYIVEEAVNSGIKDILIILGKNKKCIEDHFDKSLELELLLKNKNDIDMIEKLKNINEMANIYYARQGSSSGSACAIEIAKSFVENDPFAVLFGDDLIYSPTNEATNQLIKAYEKTQTTIIGCQEVKDCDVSKYGIIKSGKIDGKFTEILEFIEKPKLKDAPSRLASMGRFIFTSDIFDYISDTKLSSNGEKYLTDTIDLMLKNKKIFSYTFDGKRYDIGDKLGYIKAVIEYGLRNNSLNKDLKKYIKEIAGGL